LRACVAGHVGFVTIEPVWTVEVAIRFIKEIVVFALETSIRVACLTTLPTSHTDGVVKVKGILAGCAVVGGCADITVLSTRNACMGDWVTIVPTRTVANALRVV
jgi:hypothetical protein